MTDFKTPRIKIVQGWPGSTVVCTIGEVMLFDDDKQHYVGRQSGFHVSIVTDYPVHFRSLLWHEERTPEELAAVKYVKVISDEHRPQSIPYYGRIEEWLGASLGLIDITCGGRSFITYKNCEPCTEQDYLTALK